MLVTVEQLIACTSGHTSRLTREGAPFRAASGYGSRGIFRTLPVSLTSTGRWDTSSEYAPFLRGTQNSIGQLIPDDNVCRGVVLPTNAIGRGIGAQDHLFETDLSIRKSRDFHHYRL